MPAILVGRDYQAEAEEARQALKPVAMLRSWPRSAAVPMMLSDLTDLSLVDGLGLCPSCSWRLVTYSGSRIRRSGYW